MKKFVRTVALSHVAALYGPSSGSTDITSLHGYEQYKAYLHFISCGREILWCVLLSTDVSVPRLLHNHLV